ncbi:DUF6171 family protein [Alkalihalobacillus sp. LMS39]|uniref:DUF6171 family protein n=1 Tax=Alkalihalobacillus sp. LMS39 TaxID=2924032 RepID=UPI001FB1CB59|nr:DUF6171 family protein [Alkalihalobacillus sp. LMS39]UOE93034.1 DUF6171 family protein [Alkalihalobacillus sp. LMS39]
MQSQRLCRSCGISEEVNFDYVIEDKSKAVCDDIYEQRVAICMDCPSLQRGMTCKHSGDIITYRALFKEKGCPFPGEEKWSVTKK